MAITEDDIYVCDYCGEDTGKFDQDTGNHPVCIENAELKKIRALAQIVIEGWQVFDSVSIYDMQELQKALRGE